MGTKQTNIRERKHTFQIKQKDDAILQNLEQHFLHTYVIVNYFHFSKLSYIYKTQWQ